MNTLLISNSITDALGWTLLHAVWQGFVLVLPVAIVLHLLRNRSSALRYRVGVMGLLAQVLASVATFGWLYKPAVTLPATETLMGMLVQVEPIHWQTLAQPMPWIGQVQQFLTAHLSEFVLVYLIGVVLFALRLVGGWLYLQRISRTATIPVSNQLVMLTESLRGAMQLRAVVRLRESTRVTVPMVVGVLKPMLLLPVGLATDLSMAEVEAVLAHELAHVKRYDYAVNLLQSVVEVLYFFHPALWWLSARVREEREHCCDDLAVQTAGGDGRILARALARIEELRLSKLTLPHRATPALAMALTNKRQLLLHRVRRVLGVPTRPFISNGSLVGLTMATLLLLSASVYAVQQQPQPVPKVKPTQSKSTRRHKLDNSTEFGLSDNKKLDYIIWKGKKLPVSRVAKLQKLYDQVMAGQLNLDDVKQPDRDILLQLIEVNHSSDKGMDKQNDGLNADLNTDLNADLNAQGSARVDYNTIMETALDAANAAGTFPVDVAEVIANVEKIDYNSIISQAMATLQSQKTSLDSTNRHLKLYRYSTSDSLPELRAALAKLQYANAQMHSRLQTMEREWRNRVEKNKDIYIRKNQLESQRLDLQKLAVNLKKLAERTSLASAKQALTDELASANQEIAELGSRIENILVNEIETDSDRIYSVERRRTIDSIRINESRIIEICRELDIEPVDKVPVPPRPPRPLNERVVPSRPATPAAPAPGPNKVRGAIAPTAPARPLPMPRPATPPVPPVPDNG